jgi:VRR-NUC domain-containing protein
MKHLEAHEQVALFHWAAYHPICKDHLIAIPNGGSRHPREAVNLKRQGVKPGVSDVFLAYPMLPYRAGLWIELKRPLPLSSKLSKKQMLWIELMRKVGYEAVVAHGANAAIHAIETYLNPKIWSITLPIPESW